MRKSITSHNTLVLSCSGCRFFFFSNILWVNTSFCCENVMRLCCACKRTYLCPIKIEVFYRHNKISHKVRCQPTIVLNKMKKMNNVASTTYFPNKF